VSASQLVVFQVGPGYYALDIGTVQEILRVPEISPLPRMPGYMEGVIHLRGKVVPVLNLRPCLGLERISFDEHTRIILVRSKARLIGLMVDRVIEVVGYLETEVESPDAIGLPAGVLRGIVKKADRLWLLLDLERIA